MRFRKLALIGTAVVSLLVVGAGVNAPAAQATTGQGVRSGLSWIHGAYLDHNPNNIALFQTDTGKNLDAVEGFSDTSNIPEVSWQVPGAKPVTDTGGSLILSVPLWESDSTVTNTSKITSDFTALRNNLVSAGVANRTIIRLGWEMNIPFGHWTVTSSNRTAWVAAFKNAVNTLRANNSGIQIAFNPNEGASQSPSNVDIPMLAQELSNYFEYLGLDFYNWDGSMNNAAGWTTRYREPYGIKGWLYWLTVTNNTGKGFAFPEWGGTAQNTQSDDTYYAQQMINVVSTLGSGGTLDDVTYAPMRVFESYFNEPGFDYTPDWAGTISRFRLNSDSQTGTPRAAQLPALATAYKNALANVPTGTPTTPPTTQPTTSPPTSPPSCK